MASRCFLALPIVAVILSISAPVADARVVGAPFGVGDSSGNIRLNSSGPAAIRWVARRSGPLARLWVKTRTVTHGGAGDSSYYAGTTGVWRVSTYTTLANGRPDPSHLLASEEFVPALRMHADSAVLGDSTGEAVGLKLDTEVTRGSEYITVFQNVDPNPHENYASLNFLYSASGLQGAQGRNERDPQAPDELYGLDPRELVGGSYNGTWYLPGNNYGPFAKFLPTYVQQYSDGTTVGQPYYSGASIAAGTTVTQSSTAGSAGRIVSVGAFLTAADSFAASVFVDGVSEGTATLAGKTDEFVTATLAEPITVGADSVVAVTASPRVAGSLKALYADSAFSTLMGLGTSYRWSSLAMPARTVPLYPVYGSEAQSADPGPGDNEVAAVVPKASEAPPAGAVTDVGRQSDAGVPAVFFGAPNPPDMVGAWRTAASPPGAASAPGAGALTIGCAALAGARRAACLSRQRLQRTLTTCKRFRAAHAKACARRARALARCDKRRGKKRRACVRRLRATNRRR